MTQKDEKAAKWLAKGPRLTESGLPAHERNKAICPESKDCLLMPAEVWKKIAETMPSEPRDQKVGRRSWVAGPAGDGGAEATASPYSEEAQADAVGPQDLRPKDRALLNHCAPESALHGGPIRAMDSPIRPFVVQLNIPLNGHRR